MCIVMSAATAPVDEAEMEAIIKGPPGWILFVKRWMLVSMHRAWNEAIVGVDLGVIVTPTVSP
jgi:hypothetical protein